MRTLVAAGLPAAAVGTMAIAASSAAAWSPRQPASTPIQPGVDATLGYGRLMAVTPSDATVNGTLDIRAQTGAHDLVIRINTLGDPPVATPSAPIWLVNDQGLNRSSAWILDEHSSQCASAPTHFVPIGPAPYTKNQNWCLNIHLPDYGSEVTGVLHGASATIGISIEHQTGWGWPIICALLGLVVALFVVLLSSANIPNLAPSMSSGVRLRRIVRREGRRRTIDGLTRQWRQKAAEAATSAGHGPKSHRLVTYLADVVDQGPDWEDKARQGLWEALRTLPDDTDLYRSAQVEATRTDYTIDDFFDENFQPKAVPAAELLSRIESTPRTQCPSEEATAATEVNSLAAPERRDPHSRLQRAALRWLVVFVEFIPMFVAGATAVISVYLLNKTFGTWTDYLALALATAGTSAVAAAAAALLRNIAPKPSTETVAGPGPQDPST